MNSTLEYDDGAVTLEYQGGAACHNGAYNRSTSIVFICNQTADGSQGPYFVEERDDCSYIFEWQTSLVCPPQPDPIQCYVDDDDGNHYDFTDLMTVVSVHQHRFTSMHSSLGLQPLVVSLCSNVTHPKLLITDFFND